MARYNCEECGADMELIWEKNLVLCTECGRSLEISDEEMEDFDGPSSMNIYDAALIWLSNGCDEDYMFGYTEEELRAAL